MIFFRVFCVTFAFLALLLSEFTLMRAAALDLEELPSEF
jgi:hypothetical protein